MLKNIIQCKSIVKVSFESSYHWSSPTDSNQDSIIVQLRRNQVLFSIYHVITTKNAGFATSFSDMVRFAYKLLINFSNCNVMEFEFSNKKFLLPQNIDRLMWDLENTCCSVSQCPPPPSPEELGEVLIIIHSVGALWPNSALDFRSREQGSSPSQGHRVVFLGKTLTAMPLITVQHPIKWFKSIQTIVLHFPAIRQKSSLNFIRLL